MFVTLLTNLGSNDFPGCPYLEGETHEVADTLGERLVRLRLAVEVPPPSAEPAFLTSDPATQEFREKHEVKPEPDKFAKMRSEGKVKSANPK